MKKIRCFFIALLICACTGLYAADATVTFVSGKVEVQRGDKWVPLQKGDSLSKSDTVSTGFQSEAKIKIMDTVMYLGPVTRITLEELSTKGNTDNVNVYLKTGAARSQVKHVDNKRVNYQVHTAVAVASCRGTDWVIDSNNKVLCIEGMIAVAEYVPPKQNDDVEGADSENETEGSAEEDEGAGALSSDDGILVTENQSIQVSDDGVVSAPVNSIVQHANNIINAVATAAAKAKENLGGSEVQSDGNSVLSNGQDPFNDFITDSDTGTVIVIVDFDGI